MRKLLAILFGLFLCQDTFAQSCGILQQSTAIEVKVGPFLDDTDGKTAETALTITQADVRLAKNDADWAQKGETTSAVHEENGWYRVLLNTTDTATTGRLTLNVSESGALPVWCTYLVVTAGSYGLLITTGPSLVTDIVSSGPITTSGGRANADVVYWNATAVAAPDTAGVVKATIKDGTGTGEIDTLSGSIVNVDLTDTLTTYTGNTLQTGDSFARLGAPTGASISADIQTRGTHSVKRATAFEWGMKFVNSAGAPVTSGTPSCTRSIDSISAFSATTNTASAVTAAGRSELTVSVADMTGTYYVWLLCTLADAVDYEYIFKIEAA